MWGGGYKTSEVGKGKALLLHLGGHLSACRGYLGGDRGRRVNKGIKENHEKRSRLVSRCLSVEHDSIPKEKRPTWRPRD